MGVGYVKSDQTVEAVSKLMLEELVELPTDGEIRFVSQQSEIEAAVHALDAHLIRWACVAQGLSSATMATGPQNPKRDPWDNKELSEIRADDVALWRDNTKSSYSTSFRIWASTATPAIRFPTRPP